jgi:hypothetical protein
MRIQIHKELETMLVITDILRTILAWCPAIEEKVYLYVKGSMFKDFINGTVTGCKKAYCDARNKNPYCQIGKHIQARVKNE